MLQAPSEVVRSMRHVESPERRIYAGKTKFTYNKYTRICLNYFKGASEVAVNGCIVKLSYFKGC